MNQSPDKNNEMDLDLNLNFDEENNDLKDRQPDDNIMPFFGYQTQQPSGENALARQNSEQI